MCALGQDPFEQAVIESQALDQCWPRAQLHLSSNAHEFQERHPAAKTPRALNEWCHVGATP
jgi:hypothetical protein